LWPILASQNLVTHASEDSLARWIWMRALDGIVSFRPSVKRWETVSFDAIDLWLFGLWLFGEEILH
jgi:hypothetical protein